MAAAPVRVRSPAGHLLDDEPPQPYLSPEASSSGDELDTSVVSSYQAPYASSPYASPYPSLLNGDDDGGDDEEELSEARQHNCMVGWGVACFVVGVATLALTLTVFPQMVSSRADGDVQALYTPVLGSPDFESNFAERDEYESFYLFNVTNAEAVLFDAQPPRVEQIGPYVYRRRTVIPPDSYMLESISNRMSFEEWVVHEPVNTPVSFTEADGSTTTLNPRNADTELFRLLSPRALGVLTELSADPLHNAQFYNFTRDECGGNTSNAALFRCLSDALPRLSGGATTLNKTMTGLGRGLLPLRSAAAWIGIERAEDDAFWAAIDKYVARTPDSRTRDTRWAYFWNTTTPGGSPPGQGASPFRSTTVTWDANDLRQARRLLVWQGTNALRTVSQTSADSAWNQLAFEKLFAGWRQRMNFPEMLLSRGWLTHPKLSASGADSSLSVWDERLIRPVAYAHTEDVHLFDVRLLRYVVAPDNYAANSQFFSFTNGLLNMSQAMDYDPVVVSTPHFIGYTQSLLPYIPVGMPPPNAAQDTAFLDIEAESGAVFGRALRFQYNAWLPYVDFAGTGLEYKLYPDAKRQLFPAMIQERRYQLTDTKQRDTFRYLQRVARVRYMLNLYGGIGGGILTVVGLVLFFFGVRRKLASDDGVGGGGRDANGGGDGGVYGASGFIYKP